MTCKDVKIDQPFTACFAYLKPCLIFFQLGDTHEVSQLLLGQRTGNTTQLKAGSEDCITHFTAEHVKSWDNLLSVTGITCSALTQCVLKTSRRENYFRVSKEMY